MTTMEEAKRLLNKYRVEYQGFCINCGHCHIVIDDRRSLCIDEKIELVENDGPVHEKTTLTIKSHSTGECRRYPPSHTGTVDRHPDVRLLDGYCGEHNPIFSPFFDCCGVVK